MENDDVFQKKLLQKAYRTARREGYILRKSRRALSVGNGGELMLLDRDTNFPVLGFRYDATAAEVLDYLTEDE